MGESSSFFLIIRQLLILVRLLHVQQLPDGFRGSRWVMIVIIEGCKMMKAYERNINGEEGDQRRSCSSISFLPGFGVSWHCCCSMSFYGLKGQAGGKAGCRTWIERFMEACDRISVKRNHAAMYRMLGFKAEWTSTRRILSGIHII